MVHIQCSIHSQELHFSCIWSIHNIAYSTHSRTCNWILVILMNVPWWFSLVHLIPRNPSWSSHGIWTVVYFLAKHTTNTKPRGCSSTVQHTTFISSDHSWKRGYKMKGLRVACVQAWACVSNTCKYQLYIVDEWEVWIVQLFLFPAGFEFSCSFDSVL